MISTCPVSSSFPASVSVAANTVLSLTMPVSSIFPDAFTVIAGTSPVNPNVTAMAIAINFFLITYPILSIKMCFHSILSVTNKTHLLLQISDLADFILCQSPYYCNSGGWIISQLYIRFSVTIPSNRLSSISVAMSALYACDIFSLYSASDISLSSHS